MICETAPRYIRPFRTDVRCFSAARVDIIPLVSIPYVHAVIHFFDDAVQAAFFCDTIANTRSRICKWTALM